jgi:hypothetical protein
MGAVCVCERVCEVVAPFVFLLYSHCMHTWQHHNVGVNVTDLDCCDVTDLVFASVVCPCCWVFLIPTQAVAAVFQ